MSRTRGFTLIELLVAMAIVAIVGAMALGGISTVLDQQEIAEERAERWREIQFAMRVLVQDLSQIHPRPVRDETGQSFQPSVLAGPSQQFAVEFSRGGWTNPIRFKRGNVLRVAYAWEDDVLVRFHWPVADRTLATPPVRTELLHGVENIEFRFIDSAGQPNFDWPPVGAGGLNRLIMRPRAVEVAFELNDYGRVWRLVEVSS
jgi:general secretion pathway protein J